MLNAQALRQKLHHQIAQLSEAELIELESWLQQKQPHNPRSLQLKTFKGDAYTPDTTFRREDLYYDDGR